MREGENSVASDKTTKRSNKKKQKRRRKTGGKVEKLEGRCPRCAELAGQRIGVVVNVERLPDRSIGLPVGSLEAKLRPSWCFRGGAYGEIRGVAQWRRTVFR